MELKTITIEEFANLVAEKVEENLVGYFHTIKKIVKNNQVEKLGLAFCKDGSNIGPVVYIDYFYNQYVAEQMSFEQVITDVTRIVLESNSSTSGDFNVNELYDFEKMKERICVKLVNKERNKNLLDTLVSYDVPGLGDLSAVFYIYITIADGMGLINIQNYFVDSWGIDISGPDKIKDFFDMALVNTERIQGYKFASLREVIPFIPDDSMYFVTSTSYHYGAISILYPHVLEDIHERVGDFYILPSSVHELIISPMGNNENSISYIKAMIKDINETEVREDEVLSNSLYIYQNGKLQIC